MDISICSREIPQNTIASCRAPPCSFAAGATAPTNLLRFVEDIKADHLDYLIINLNMLTCWTTVYIDALACMFSKGCFMTCFPASEKWSWNSRSQDLWQLEACFTHFTCGSATYWHQPTQNSIQYVCVSVCVLVIAPGQELCGAMLDIFSESAFFFFGWMCVGQEHKPDVAEVSWQYVTMSAMGNC